MKYVEHIFKPSETIKSVIHLKNMHSTSKDELKLLLAEFDAVNNHRIPTAGASFLIPILDRHFSHTS